jgi:hypothetical protein
MKKLSAKKVAIFLSLDEEILQGYFNAQDPAPLYKKQLSHDFEKYIMTSIRSAKRNSEFNYRISYRNESEKQYAEPLAYAIRRHFSEIKTAATTSFLRFKRRTYMLLFMSITVVIICQGIVPLLFNKDGHNSIQTGLVNSMDVLCWVILWKPIERLIFYWNPHLKEISILERLEKAEVIITEVEG